MTNNGISGDFIQKLAFAYYESHYGPSRKPFDLYVALALIEGVPSHEECKVFYDSKYGTCIIGNRWDSWDKTFSNLKSNIVTTDAEGDTPFIVGKKRALRVELPTVSTLGNDLSANLYRMNCFNVRFKPDSDKFTPDLSKSATRPPDHAVVPAIATLPADPPVDP